MEWPMSFRNWISKSLSRFGKFLAIISLNKFSAQFSLFSPSVQMIFVLLMMSQTSLGISSLFHFFSFYPPPQPLPGLLQCSCPQTHEFCLLIFCWCSLLHFLISFIEFFSPRISVWFSISLLIFSSCFVSVPDFTDLSFVGYLYLTKFPQNSYFEFLIGWITIL